MLPTLYLGPYPLSTYYLFLSLSILAIFVFGAHWNYAKGAKYPVSPYLMFWFGIPALLLGRASYFLLFAYPCRYYRFWDLSYGGMMFLGSFIGGIAGALAYFEYRRIPKWAALDVFIPYVPVGSILGRLGCLCYGCCYGRPSNLPWSIGFPVDTPVFYSQVRSGLIASGAPHSLPVHPSQIYAMLGWLVIMTVLLGLRRRGMPPGGLFLSLIVLYMAKRFVLDFFRGDYMRLFLGLDLMQLLAIPTVLIGGWMLYRLAFRAGKMRVD